MKKNRGLFIIMVLHLFIIMVNANVCISNSFFENNLGLVTDSVKRFSASGYFDTYYFANLNHPSDRSNLGSSGVSRGFDRYPGQFQLGMLLTRMKYSDEKVLLVAEIGYGPNVEYGSYGNDFRYKWGTTLANNTLSAILIKQAYIEYRATDKFTVTMGQFGTHIGYEYIDAPLNFHYSINNTFNSGIPFYHTGLKLAYSLRGNISLMTGIVNGTDNINDNNRGKSIIAQLSVATTEYFNVSFNTIQGNEANARSNGNDTTSYFGVLDLVTTYHVSKKFMMSSWLMRGTLRGEYQGGKFDHRVRHWLGLNIYATYKISNTLIIGSRIEYFDNRNAARQLLTHGLGTDVMTYTITGNVTLANGQLILKPEIRTDKFRKMNAPAGMENSMQQFVDSKGNFSKNSQCTIGMAAIIKF